MPFDPDAYLKKKQGGFDPDAYLAKRSIAEPVEMTAKEKIAAIRQRQQATPYKDTTDWDAMTSPKEQQPIALPEWDNSISAPELPQIADPQSLISEIQSGPEGENKEGLPSRFGKQLYNQIVTQSMKPNITMEMVGEANRRAEARAIKDAGGAEGKFDHSKYIELIGKYQNEEQQKLTNLGKSFDVPAPETIGEKATDIGAGIVSFITKAAAFRKAMPTAPPAAIFEAVNQAEGGAPGRGVAMGNALSMTNGIPASTILGKIAKPGAAGTVFASMAAIEGGSTEDIAIAFMIPYAMKAVDIGTQSKPAQIIKMKFALKEQGIDTSKIPSDTYSKVWDFAKQARELQMQAKEGRIPAQVYERKMANINAEIRAMGDKIKGVVKQPPKTTVEPERRVKPVESKIVQPPTSQPAGQTAARPVPTAPQAPNAVPVNVERPVPIQTQPVSKTPETAVREKPELPTSSLPPDAPGLAASPSAAPVEGKGIQEKIETLKKNVYKAVDNSVFLESVPQSIQKDGQKLIDAVYSGDTKAINKLALKYQKDVGRSQGGIGAGPGKVKQARPGAAVLGRMARRAYDTLTEQALDTPPATEQGGETPDFVTYQEAIDWIEKRSKDFGGKNKYTTTDEYKKIFPQIQKLYEYERSIVSDNAKKAMSDSGVAYGDIVNYGYVTPFGVTEYSGVLVEIKGIPYVKLDSGQTTISGAKSVRWHKGWVKEAQRVSETPKPAERKMTYTNAPVEWFKVERLSDFGKGLRLPKGSTPLPAGMGTKKKRLSFVWADQFDKIPVRLEDKAVMEAARQMTDEVVKVKNFKGDDYYLAPKPVVEQLKKQFGDKWNKQRPAPTPSPLQKLYYGLNALKAKKLSDEEIGAYIVYTAEESNIPLEKLSEKALEYVQEYRNAEQARIIEPISESQSGDRQADAGQLSAAGKEEADERWAIQHEDELEEIGNFLDGIVDETPAPQQPKTEADLLGRPELKGGASGSQREMFDRENFKTIQEQERVNAKNDIKGQTSFLPHSKQGGSGSVVGSPLGGKTRDMKLDLEPEGKLPKKIINKHHIIRSLSKAFGVPIRGMATHRKGSAAGWYSTFAKGIRQVKPKEILTAAHEVGHHIDHAYGIRDATRSKQGRRTIGLPHGAEQELIKLGKDLYGDKKPVGGYASEGVAEFIRGYLTESIDVSQAAPKFNTWFRETYFKDYPEIESLLKNARAMYRLYRKQGARARIRGSRYKGNIPSTLSTSLRRIVTRLKADWITELAPLEQGIKDAGIDRKKLRPSEDPIELATAFSDKSKAKAIQFTLEGTSDLAGNITGKPLKEILAPVADDIERFLDWAESTKAIQLAKLGIDPGLELGDAKYIHEKDKNPVYESVLKEWTDWNRSGLKYMVEAEAMSQDAYDAIIKKHPIYIPFQRAFEKGEIRSGGGGSGKGYANTASPVKKIKGSDRPRIDPIMASIHNMEKMISVSQKTAVARSIARLAGKEGVAGLIWKVPAPQQAVTFSAEKIKQDVIRLAKEHLGLDLSPGEVSSGMIDQWDDLVTVFMNAEQYRGKDNIVKIKFGGEIYWYEVHPDLYSVLMGMDQYVLPWYADFIFGKANRAVRLGATGINASFGLVRNFIRDSLWFTAMSKHAKLGPVSTLTGVVKDIVDSPDAKRFKALGGKMSGQIGHDITSTKPVRQAALASGATRWTIHKVSHPIDAMRELFGVTEAGSRIGEFGPALKFAEDKWGKGTLDAAIYALNAGQDVTTNFTRHGRIAKILNQVVPFFNANIQGKSKILRTIKDRPISTLLKAIASLTIPAFLLWFLNRDEEWFRNLPAYEKANYLHFRIPGTETIVRIPVPFELGYIFQSIPVGGIDALYRSEPEAANDILRVAIEQSNPADWPAIISPIIDIWRNKDFAGRPIVPKYAERKLPEDQFTPHTTELMKTIGKWLDVSPAEIEHLTNSYSGGLYGRVARSSEGTAEIGRDFEPADIPIYGTLFLREDQKYRPAAKIDRFYKKLDELSRKHASNKITKEEYKERQVYDKVSRNLSKEWAQFRENKDMTLDERKSIYERIEKLIDYAERK